MKGLPIRCYLDTTALQAQTFMLRSALNPHAGLRLITLFMVLARAGKPIALQLKITTPVRSTDIRL